MKAVVEFVSKEACLTENEATKFEPLLREMHQKQHTLMEKQRKSFFRSRKNQSLTEEDFERLVNNSISTDIEVKKIEQTYYKKFHNVMPWKKVFAVRIALNKWQMEALNRFQPDRGNRRNQQPNRQKSNSAYDPQKTNWRINIENQSIAYVKKKHKGTISIK